MPKAKQSDESGGVDPVRVALWGVLLIVALAAVQVYWTAGAVINAAQDKDTYALFVTDSGIASDNAAMEEKVNNGLDALRGARKVGLALLSICFGLGLALAWRSIAGLDAKPLQAGDNGRLKMASRRKR